MQKLSDFGVSLVVLVAIGFLPSGFIAYLIRERKREEKQVQLVSGVTRLRYWLAISIWDFMVIYIFLNFSFDNLLILFFTILGHSAVYCPLLCHFCKFWCDFVYSSRQFAICTDPAVCLLHGNYLVGLRGWEGLQWAQHGPVGGLVHKHACGDVDNYSYTHPENAMVDRGKPGCTPFLFRQKSVLRWNYCRLTIWLHIFEWCSSNIVFAASCSIKWIVLLQMRFKILSVF